VSKAQNRAMHSAAEGKSNLGIPQSVGEDFIEADAGTKVSNLPQKKSKPIAPHKKAAVAKALMGKGY